MPHNFKLEDLQRLASNDVLSDHPDFAKVWRDLDRNVLLVTTTDDFCWFPERYEFLGHIRQARQAYETFVANELAAVERFPAPVVRISVTTRLTTS